MNKSIKISIAQQEQMLSYMEKHDLFARGQLLGPLGKMKEEEKWKKLATCLNSVGNGASKDTSKWKSTWSDWKCKTKAKAQAIKKHQQGTGSGPPTTITLSSLEERLMSLTGWEAAFGDDNLRETGFAIPEAAVENTPLLEVTEVDLIEDHADNFAEIVVVPTGVEEHIEVSTASPTTAGPSSDGRTQNKSRSSMKKTRTHNNVTSTPYDRAATAISKIEQERLPIQKKLCVLVEVISKDLKCLREAVEVQATAVERIAAAAERRAAAAERKASAMEQKAAAAAQKAAAMERIAIVKEFKYGIVTSEFQ